MSFRNPLSCVIKRCAKWSIPLDRWKRLNLSRPSTCFTKQSFDATQKNGPKLKVAEACSKKLSLGQFSPRTRHHRNTPSIVDLHQFKPRWPIRVCETESTFSRTKYSKRNQSTNKEQQITATANSIYCNEKQIFQQQQQQRTKEEKRGWNWFQGRFPASNFPGQVFRWRTPDSKRDPVTEAKEPVGVGQCELVGWPAIDWEWRVVGV